MTRNVTLLLFVAILAVSAGCMGLGGDDGEDGEYLSGGNGNGNGDAPASDTAGSDGESASTDGETSADALASAQDDPGEGDRQLIRTAALEVSVDSFTATRGNLTAEASTSGGYLADSSQETREREVRDENGNETTETWTTGTLTYRVPSEEFDSFYETVTETGNVTHASTDTEDVGDELVDLEARIDTLESQRDRLRELYEDANETEEVLAVEERLSDVQSEIERLEASEESLLDRVAYSTVTVTLSEPEPEHVRAERAEVASWYETSVTNAFVSSVGGVATVARASVVAGAYAAPYVLAFGTPLVLVAAVRRRFRAGSGESFEDQGGDEE